MREVDTHRGFVAGDDPVRSEQCVPQHIAENHVVAQRIIVSEFVRTDERLLFVAEANVFRGPALCIAESAKALLAVELPCHHLGDIHVIPGPAAGAADKDDRGAAIPREVVSRQCRLPDVEHALFESVQETAGPVEAGQFEMGQRERFEHRDVDRQRAKPLGNVIELQLIVPLAECDPCVTVATGLIDSDAAGPVPGRRHDVSKASVKKDCRGGCNLSADFVYH